GGRFLDREGWRTGRDDGKVGKSEGHGVAAGNFRPKRCSPAWSRPLTHPPARQASDRPHGRGGPFETTSPPGGGRSHCRLSPKGRGEKPLCNSDPPGGSSSRSAWAARLPCWLTFASMRKITRTTTTQITPPTTYVVTRSRALAAASSS